MCKLHNISLWQAGPTGCGTAILIRKDVKHNEFLLPHLQRVEATAIQLRINKELIILTFVYKPPGQIIERDLDQLKGMGHKVILAGDFNTKHISWHARQNNTAGQTLLKHYYKNNYVISVPSNPRTSRTEIPHEETFLTLPSLMAPTLPFRSTLTTRTLVFGQAAQT
jgi:hypothetical protein